MTAACLDIQPSHLDALADAIAVAIVVFIGTLGKPTLAAVWPQPTRPFVIRPLRARKS